MGGGKGSAPPAPDYTGAAIAQGEASQKLAREQTQANRTNAVTPWGSVTWSQGMTGGTPGTPGTFDEAGYNAAMQAYQQRKSQVDRMGGGNLWASAGRGQPAWVPNYLGAEPTKEQFTTGGSPGTPGTPTWTQTVTLSPDQQAALDAQQRIQKGQSALAESLLPQIAQNFGKPIDTSNLVAMPGQQSGIDLSQLPSAGINPGETYTDAALRFYEPIFAKQRASLDQNLANQGIGLGAEAFSAGQRDLSDQQDRARLQAVMSGMDKNLAYRQQGLGEQQAMQDAALRAAQANLGLRQAGINEQQQLRGIPLNELQALLTGQQVSNPQFPSVIPAGVGQAPNLLGALQAQYDAQLNATNAQNAARGNFMSGLFGLGSAGLMGGLLR